MRLRVSSSSFCPSWLAAISLRRALLQRRDAFDVRRDRRAVQEAGSQIDEADQIGEPLGHRHLGGDQLEQRHHRLVGVAAERHGDHGDVGLGLFTGRHQHLVELGLGRLGGLHDLFAARAELETIVDRAVERGQLGIHRRDQLLETIDRVAIGLGVGDAVEPFRNSLLPGLERGHFLLPLGLRFRRQQGRRGTGQRLGVRLQSQRLDDFRNVAAGDPVEKIANLREHQPGGGAGDNRGSRYRSESEEELGPDSELAR